MYNNRNYPIKNQKLTKNLEKYKDNKIKEECIKNITQKVLKRVMVIIIHIKYGYGVD